MKRISSLALLSVLITTSSLAAGNFEYRWYTTQGPHAKDFSVSYCDPHFKASPKSQLTSEIRSYQQSSLVARNQTLKTLSDGSWNMSAFEKVASPNLLAVMKKKKPQIDRVLMMMRKLGTLKSVNQPGVALIKDLPGSQIVGAVFCFPADFSKYKNVRMNLTFIAKPPYKDWKLLKFSAKSLDTLVYDWITTDGNEVAKFLPRKDIAAFKSKNFNKLNKATKGHLKKWMTSSVNARNSILKKISSNGWTKDTIMNVGTAHLRKEIAHEKKSKANYNFNFMSSLGPLVRIDHPGQARLIIISKKSPIVKTIFYFPASFKNAKDVAVNMSLISKPPYDKWQLEGIYLHRNYKLNI